MTGRLYDGDQVIAEYDETGTVTAQFVHGPGLGADVGSMVCSESIDNGAAAAEWFCYNWRGDVIGVTDGGGAVLSSYRYDAFGQVIGSGMPDRGFSSKEYNERTSLSYFGARYYDASIGRFISRDPLGFVDGPNEYIYCANNPIGCVDPWGLWKRTAWNYVKDAGEQFVLGDYTDKTNALGTGLQIAAGIAGVDLIADVRDISASFVNWEWSWKHLGKTTLNVVGVLPGIGAIKNIDEAGAVIKGFAKNADEASSLAKGAVKNTDDVTQNVLKSHDDFDEFISTFNSRSKYKSRNLTHGNLKTNTTEATLYGKFDKDGNFLKWGKSQNPQYRYTNTELDGGYVKPYRTGPTDQILDQERKLVERFPGPENNELWAGWKNPTHPNYKETR